jgi:hypothetical protein
VISVDGAVGKTLEEFLPLLRQSLPGDLID